MIGPRDRFPLSTGRAYEVPDAPYEDLDRLHRTLGFERAALVQASVHGADNGAMLDALARAGGRYRGVAIVDETVSDADLERMDRAGVCGVRFNFVPFLGGPPEPDRFDRVVDRIAELGWHVAVHIGCEDLPRHETRLRALPVPVVIEHMGRVDVTKGTGDPGFRNLLRLARDAGFWVKIDMGERLSVEGPPYRDMIPFARAIVEAAPDRVLWGTDWPHPMYDPDRPMPNDGDLVDLLSEYAPDRDTRERILVANAARLYRYEDTA